MNTQRLGGIDPVARFLLAVAVVVMISHLLGVLLRRLHQPPVVGAVFGGLLLGPSGLKFVWPAASGWLFTREVVAALGMISQLGLVIFMFLLGCQLRFHGMRRGRRAVLLVILGAMGLPFVGGSLIAVLGHDMIAGSSPDRGAFVVFVGLTLAVTALPVLARVLADLRLDGTHIGALALACAAVGDGLTWGVLTITLGLSGSNHAATTVGLAAGVILVTFLWIRPLLATFVRWAERRADAGQILLPVLLAGAMGMAATTELVGLHPVIGAFLFGVIVPHDSPATERINHQMQAFVVTILLPLFFVSIGLTTSVGLLGGSPAHWLLFGVMLLTAFSTKFLGAAGGARLIGLSRPDALRMGALMNCRGVTELVVAAIGYQHHLINALGLTMLVLVALISTALTGPLIRVIGPVGALGAEVAQHGEHPTVLSL